MDGSYPASMQVFFTTEKEIGLFLSRLAGLCCPVCGATGTLVRHGYIRWKKGRKENSVRAWRVHCKGNTRRQGCGHAPSVRLGNTLPRRYFSADELWAFIQELLDARSIKNAWEVITFRKGFPSSLSNTYKLVRRLALCQTVLRTQLNNRGPPPKMKAGVPLLHVLAHVKEVFGGSSPVAAYQLSFQRDFLAVT